MTVSAVIFDWGGTLTPWHTIDPVAAWAATVPDPDQAARLLSAENAVWARSRDEHRSATLAEIFLAAGVEPTPEALAAHHAWWEPHTFTDEQVAPLFEALRSDDIRVGILSNTIWPRSVHEQIFARDGVDHLIDGAVYTSDIEYTKPHPEAFRAAMDAVGVTDPKRCVFVGDRLFDDVYGAQQAGMRAIHVPHSVIPRDQIGHTEGEPDATITELAEVLAVVRSWQ